MEFITAESVTETLDELHTALEAARNADEDTQPILRKIVLKLGFFQSVQATATVNVSVSASA